MDQNQTADNQIIDNQAVDNELQKAIDNITNTTNVDPVFSDPVAAPSSVPEGDSGELEEPVGPFPEPVPEPAPAPELAPAPAPDPAAAPDLSTAGLNAADLPMPEPAPEAPAVAPEAPASEPLIPEPAPMPEAAPLTAPEPVAEPAPAMAPAPTLTSFNQPTTGLSTHQIKEAALRDLVPILGHLNMGPAQKFSLYRDIFEQLKDYTVLDAAYQAARDIPNEAERAEALLYLVQSIDKM